MRGSFRTRNCQVSAVFYSISTDDDNGRVESIFQVNISCCRFEILRHHRDVAYSSNINPRGSIISLSTFPFLLLFLSFLKI